MLFLKMHPLQMCATPVVHSQAYLTDNLTRVVPQNANPIVRQSILSVLKYKAYTINKSLPFATSDCWGCNQHATKKPSKDIKTILCPLQHIQTNHAH
jgi:hypothetical protein